MALGRLVPRPWRTLRGRLALASLVGLLAASIVFALVGTSLLRSEAEGVARDELDRQARAIGRLVSARAQEAVQRTQEFRWFRVANLEPIVGPETRLYVDRGTLPLSPGGERPYHDFPATVARQIDYPLLEREGLQRIDFTRPDGTRTEAAAAPIVIDGEVFGAILLSRPPSEITPDWGAFGVRVALAALAGLALALALSIFLTGRLTRPLLAMRVAARRVGRGDRRVTLQRTRTQELDALADAFNAMVRELAKSDALSREFLMRVTHDLRTPLTAIRGHAAALADGVVPEADVPRSLGAIEGEAARLERLVADLLDLARLDAHRFRLELAPALPAELLERAADAFAAEAASRGVDLRREIAPAPELVTDEARVRQIVSNLLENALRWTPAGGTVRLAGRAREDGGLVVVVSDDGPGVPPGELERIFEPFHAHDGPDGRRGSGLGLAISRQLARALGGDLRAESREGAGSRFTLELPGAGSGAPAPPPAVDVPVRR